MSGVCCLGSSRMSREVPISCHVAQVHPPVGKAVFAGHISAQHNMGLCCIALTGEGRGSNSQGAGGRQRVGLAV